MKTKVLLTAIVGVMFSTVAQAEQRFVIPVALEGQLTGYVVDTKKGELNIFALSGGCLSKSNFKVSVYDSLPPKISIVQISNDACEAVVTPTALTYSFEELGIGNNAIQVTSKSTVGLGQQ